MNRQNSLLIISAQLIKLKFPGKSSENLFQVRKMCNFARKKYQKCDW